MTDIVEVPNLKKIDAEARLREALLAYRAQKSVVVYLEEHGLYETGSISINSVLQKLAIHLADAEVEHNAED